MAKYADELLKVLDLADSPATDENVAREVAALSGWDMYEHWDRATRRFRMNTSPHVRL